MLENNSKQVLKFLYSYRILLPCFFIGQFGDVDYDVKARHSLRVV